MAKYRFLRMARIERASVGVCVGEKVVDVIFKDGVFDTDDEALAEAIKKHPSFACRNFRQRIVLLMVNDKPAEKAPAKVEEPIPAPIVEEDDTKRLPPPVPEVASATESLMPVDYFSMTKAKLLQLAKKIGVHVHGDDNKDQIVAALEAHDKQE